MCLLRNYNVILIWILNFSVLRNLKTTRHSFEPAWADLRNAMATGGHKKIQRDTGIKRVSALRELPQLRPVFHVLFAQDPMHDFAEGVVLWFLHLAIRTCCCTETELVTALEKLNSVRNRISPSLRWPMLVREELREQNWHVNGMCRHLFLITSCCVHASCIFSFSALGCSCILAFNSLSSLLIA